MAASASSLGRKWRTNMGQAQGTKMKLDQTQEATTTKLVAENGGTSFFLSSVEKKTLKNFFGPLAKIKYTLYLIV
jgi:hypothetical protein